MRKRPAAFVATAIVVALAALALHREVAVAVDHVGLAEQRALPFGGLLQEMAPGDRTVMRSVESAIIHRGRHGVVQFRNQPVGDSNACKQAQIALGDREGEIDLTRIAPGRHHRTVTQDQTVRCTTCADRPEDFVERRRLEEPGFDMRAQTLMGHRDFGHNLELIKAYRATLNS